MEEKKYELLKDDTIIVATGRILYRIKALKDFGDVKKGDLGGYLEKEDNLSQEGNCWVCNNARVLADARVFGNARISGDADISSNFDFCTISGFGSEAETITFFRCKDGSIKVDCECYNGTLEEFREKVKETHKDTKYAKEYLMAADLAELRLTKED